VSLGEEIAGDGEQGILDAEVSVDDEEFNARRRIKAINDARDRVRRSYYLSKAREIEGVMTQLERRQAVRSTVRVYFSEVRPIIRHELNEESGDDEMGDAGELLVAEALGTVALQAPRGVDEAERVETNVRSDLAVRNGTSIQVRGVQALVELPSPIVATWQYSTTTPIKGRTGKQAQTQTELPCHMSLYAAECIDEFLAENGFGVVDDVDEHSLPDFGDYEVVSHA